MTSILLVDDSATILMSMSSILGRAVYQVEQAASGEAAIGKLKGGVAPKLIITDFNMPGSAQLISEARKLAAFRFVPMLGADDRIAAGQARRGEGSRCHWLAGQARRPGAAARGHQAARPGGLIMRPAMVAGGATATEGSGRAGAARQLLPIGAFPTALAGAGVAFGTLAIVENFAVAATGAAVVACTLLVSESLMRRPRQNPDAGEALAARPPEAPLPEAPATEPDDSAAAARAGAAEAEAQLAALCDYVEKLPDLFTIMKEHTRNVIADTERASYSFVDNLGEIDQKIKALKEFLLASQQDISAIDPKSSESDARNDELIDQIRQSFAQNSDLIASIIDERSGFSPSLRPCDGCTRSSPSSAR